MKNVDKWVCDKRYNYNKQDENYIKNSDFIKENYSILESTNKRNF